MSGGYSMPDGRTIITGCKVPRLNIAGRRHRAKRLSFRRGSRYR